MTESEPKQGTLPWYLTSKGWAELLVERTSLVLGVLLLLGGWAFILDINQWHPGAPTVFLCLGWAAVLLSVRFVWRAGVVAAAPGDGPEDEGFDLAETREDELVREKRALLKAIKEIEFDRELGKMSEEDAAPLIRDYRARAIAVIKALEGVTERELPLSERIERDVAARVQTLPSRAVREQLMAAAASDQQRLAKGKRKRPRPADTLAGDTRPGDTRSGSKKGTLPGTTDRRAFADDMLADAEVDEDAVLGGGTGTGPGAVGNPDEEQSK